VNAYDAGIAVAAGIFANHQACSHNSALINLTLIINVIINN